MAYRKRHGSILESFAEIKLTVLKSFDTANGSVINYGSTGKSLSSADYEEKINSCKNLRDDLNTMLETADSKVNLLNQEMKELRKMSSKFLAAVKSRFGEDSTEYDQFGGTRISNRKKVVRKAKTPAQS